MAASNTDEARMKLTLFRAIVLAVLVGTLVLPASEIRAFAQPPQTQQQQQQQQKPPEPEGQYAISVEVPLVNVDVVVTDNRGTFISGLKKENFRVLEDGVPQKITNFASTEAPITIVLLMEFSKVAYSFFYTVDWTYQFLNVLDKDDWVALVTFDLKTHIEADFTKNKGQIRQVLRELYLPTFTESSLFDAVIETVDRLEDVKGKKSILLVATGIDTSLGKHSLDDALKAVKDTDVTIFAVGAGREIFEYFDNRGALGSLGRLTYYQAQNQLNSFARITGGRAWFPRFQGELPSIFQEVAGHLRNQYSLGYAPSNPKRDGKYHKIKVELVGGDGKPLVVVDQNRKKVKYQVYAREGYVAPQGGVS